MPIVAISTSDEDHDPPGVASVSVMVAPVQTVLGPVMLPATANGLTVTIVVV